MILARGVGILVGIVAILSWFIIMMIFRAILVWIVHFVGITGLIIIMTSIIVGTMKYAKMSGVIIWNMFINSCN